MRRLLLSFVLLLALAGMVDAQVSSSTARRVRAGSSLPATCKASNPVDIFIRTGATNPGFYFCSATNTWSGPFIFGSAGITNSASNGQLAISNGTNIVGDADLTFATDTLTATKISTPQIVDTNGNELIKFTTVPSAVNELSVADAATGNSPTISATGGDSNIPLALSPKGSGGTEVRNGATEQKFRVYASYVGDGATDQFIELHARPLAGTSHLNVKQTDNLAYGGLAINSAFLAIGDGTSRFSINVNSALMRSAGIFGWSAGGADPGTAYTTTISQSAAGIFQIGTDTNNSSGSVKAAAYLTDTNCSDSAGAAACGSASAGSVVIDAASTSVVVSTTAVTASSQIFVQNDSSLGTRLSVTCNTQSSLTLGTPRITARTAGTSFTITIEAGPTTNPMCLSYRIVN